MIEKLTKPEIRAFIREHLEDDPAELMLKRSSYEGVSMKDIVVQVESRQRAKKKLPGWFSNEQILFPPKQNLEQASSEQTARFKSCFVKGGRLVDLTGGTGVDTWYLSQNCASAVYVEPNAELCEIAVHNFEVLGSGIEVSHTKAEEFLISDTEKAEWIFVDPSRRDDRKNRVYALEDCEPNVIELKPQLLDKAENVLVKASPMLDIKQALKKFTECFRVQIVAVDNEVKELLFYLKTGFEGGAEIEAWNLSERTYEQCLNFTYINEQEAIATIAKPKTYLYEPNPSIMKSGAYNLVSAKFSVSKLQSNTHLYTSDNLVEDFPGRILRIKEVFKPSRKEIQKRIPEGRINVVVRNYPAGANEVKTKFRLRDGGEQFLVFCEIEGEGFKAIWCERTIQNSFSPTEQ